MKFSLLASYECRQNFQFKIFSILSSMASFLPVLKYFFFILSISCINLLPFITILLSYIIHHTVLLFTVLVSSIISNLLFSMQLFFLSHLNFFHLISLPALIFSHLISFQYLFSFNYFLCIYCSLLTYFLVLLIQHMLSNNFCHGLHIFAKEAQKFELFAGYFD